MRTRSKSVVGKRNGMIVVLSVAKRRYFVRCDCGVEKSIDARNFYKTQSCGCAWKELIGKATTTHGYTKGSTQGVRRSAEYETWGRMIQRCTNPKNPSYPDYGGRGIKVCERWRDFPSFLADMGPRPPGYEIDRYPDNDGDYKPGNCRWATQTQQVRNRRVTRRAEVGGSTVVVADAADAVGFKLGTVCQRLDRGWTGDEALTERPNTRPELNLPIGSVFHSLTVLENVGRQADRPSKHVYYRVRCACGNETLARGSKLVAGEQKSCSQWCPAGANRRLYDKAREAAENAPGQVFADLARRGRAQK